MAKADAPLTVETPADKQAEAAPPAKDVPSSGNKWTDLGADIAKLGATTALGELETKEAEPAEAEAPAKEKAATPPPPAKPAPEEQPEAREEEAGEEEEREDEEPRAEREGEEAETRYSVVASDGGEFEFEPLPKGAKLEFKAGGKKVAVTSLDELVGMAQQVPGLRQMETTYQTKLKAVGKQNAALIARLQAADHAFQELLEDDEALEKYRARAAKLKDPDYRDGLEAKRKLAERQEQDASEGEAALEEVTTEFWQEAERQFTGKLEDYPALEAEDYPDVVRTFWGNFTAHRAALAEQALTELGTEELTEAQLEAVDEAAIAWLTEEHFEAAMRAHHERLERRSGRTGGGNGRRRAATEEEAAKAEADAHNKHVDDKLRQRDQRTLKGKGAPPGRGGEEPKRPGTWADHMAGIRDEFDKAKKPAVAD
jgi:hypothetical protein